MHHRHPFAPAASALNAFSRLGFLPISVDPESGLPEAGAPQVARFLLVSLVLMWAVIAAVAADVAWGEGADTFVGAFEDGDLKKTDFYVVVGATTVAQISAIAYIAVLVSIEKFEDFNKKFLRLCRCCCHLIRR